MNFETIVLIIAGVVILVSIGIHGLIGTVAVFALLFSIAHFGFDIAVMGSAVIASFFLALSFGSDSTRYTVRKQNWLNTDPGKNGGGKGIEEFDIEIKKR